MIKNQWYAVMESDRIRPGQVVSAVRLGKRLAFFVRKMERLMR